MVTYTFSADYFVRYFLRICPSFNETTGLANDFCHKLETDEKGMITAYKLRQPDQKRQAVKALHGLNFRVIAAGDSYNDTTMLSEADKGFLFDAPDNVIAEFPQFPPINGYAALKEAIRKASNRDIPD